MRKHIIVSIIALFFIAFNQVIDAKKIPSEKPKLIISIVVDQMKYNYLNYYWNEFGENGFKKITTEGTLCKNARYNYLYTQSAVGYATIATGTTPTYHGIISNYWYDRLKENTVFCTYNENESTIEGNFEAGKMSPHYLLSTTIADELRISDEFKSKVFGVSLNAYSSILSTGHNANAAFWFDDMKGNWISSSYYMDSLPGWVKDFNEKKLPDIYLDREWKPLTDYNITSAIDDSSYTYKQNNVARLLRIFNYDLSKFKRKKEAYKLFQETPFSNTFTFDFAKNLIVNENLGKDDFTDFISISLTANSIIGQKYGQGSLELKDVYTRLDYELAQFIEFIEFNIGMENTLIILTSDRGASFDPEYLGKYKIPSGYFNSDQAISLLKSYLNIIYGKGKWIEFYYKSQIYLNRNLIEDSQIPLEDFQTKVAQFMIQFNGVANAITSSSLQSSNFSTGIFNKFQYSYNQNRSGDVLLNLEPGWIEKDDNLTMSNSSYTYDTHVPLIFYGWKIRRASISRLVDIVDIAPTISNLIDIPYTNANIGNPIIELVE